MTLPALPTTARLLRRAPLVAALVLLTYSQPAHAQVGYLPDRSPYEDVQLPQTFSFSTGWLGVRRDPPNIAPASSPFFSLLYDLPVGGPAFLYARYAFAPSSRNVLNPVNPARTRLVGKTNVTTSLVDVGLDLSMTGQKTFHGFMPSATAGIGLASDFAKADTGAYRFGTKFSFSYGFVLRYLFHSGWGLRADVTNNIWQYQYPDGYFVKSSDTTSVLSDTKQRSAWRSNWGFSAGVSVPVFR